MREKGRHVDSHAQLFFEAGLQVRELWSPTSYAKLEVAAETHKAAYKMAVAKGVNEDSSRHGFMSRRGMR